MSFNKILIANRGEIACRVIRSAQRLGYRTVAVYSDADANALHVSQADEALRIGAAPAADSYLSVEALLAAARRSGAQALHPGYGFLSENADFAETCVAAGLVFIGPPGQAIRTMGDKARAKQRMREVGVPCAPGYLGDDQSDATLLVQARLLGLPLLVKAVAGGGGRGMRMLRDWSQWGDALNGARREARAAFGDERLMLESLIERGRHIEVQVFADAHGAVLHLGDRDCSAQRRRQKLIEEAPAPGLSPALREALGRDAVAAARAVDYRGAGTVEFIVDAEERHHFLEMNTRLQVEHTVTECITGLDLVEWQLRVAAGEPLPLRQDQLRFSGHAIQARLYAEDPYESWQPQTGRVTHWRPEQARIRIDHGVQQGSDVTPHYDALLAKFIAHGSDRADALRRLTHALEDLPLLGLRNNARFLRDLLQSPQFGAAEVRTDMLDAWHAHGHALLQRPQPDDQAWRIAAALMAGRPGWRPDSLTRYSLTLSCQGPHRQLAVPVVGVKLIDWQDDIARLEIDGVQRRVVARREGAALQLVIDSALFEFAEPAAGSVAADPSDPRRVCSPLAGVVGRISVQPGDSVRLGQPLLCVEAMKMEMWLSASGEGRVKAVNAKPRDAVAKGQLLIEIDLEPDGPTEKDK